MAPKICGPKTSTCCTVLSLWGVIMLALLGVFFRVNSMALFEDIDLPKQSSNLTQKILEQTYTDVSNNCFIAAGIYVFWLVFSVWQLRVNNKRQYSVS